MLFNSIEFLVFFPIVTVAFFAIPSRWQWLLLLAASCLFYMAFIPVYILILLGTILIDYAAGLLIAPASGRRRRLYLMMSLAANISILAVFKYYNFFNETMAASAAAFGIPWAIPALTMALPIGLSFHTFQAMSYTIEVYRGRCPAERHLGIYALYVMFYPQLVAGPIERPQNLLPQFHRSHAFDPDRVSSGLQLILWGLIKKVVIADRLAQTVDAVYSQPALFSGPALIVATVFFAWQIYCDFSGYSDIALGAAEVMGFKLMVNFRRPYLSQSVAEFWTRWHVSLSTWFRDYVYLPLGGNRVALPRWSFNVAVTFLISGLWHGPNWTFVIWGGLNGALLILEKLVGAQRADRTSVIRPLAVAATFAAICVTWVFFRATSVSQAWLILEHAVVWSRAGTAGLPHVGTPALGVTLIALLWVIEARTGDDIRDVFRARPFWIGYSTYFAAVIGLLALGVFNGSRFIYFQF